MKLLVNDKYLDEDYRVKDAFGFQETQAEVEAYIEHARNNSIIALVGPYGGGKSTLLHQIETQNEDKEIWFHFDAWKYPDRNALWEGMVLDIAEQIGKSKKIVGRIDANETKPRAAAKTTINVIANIANLLTQIPVFGPVGEAIGGLFDRTPVKRVFEVQQILLRLLNEQPLPVRVVIEDIDRSGDSGVYFLETLNHFLKNQPLENEVKVIAPMATENYNDPRNQVSFRKSVDYHKPFKVTVRDVNRLVDEVLSPDLFSEGSFPAAAKQMKPEHMKDQLTAFLQELFRHQISPRDFKAILREWSASYYRHKAQGKDVDYRLELLVQASKFVTNDHGSRPYYMDWESSKSINRRNLFGTYVQLIYSGSIHFRLINSKEFNAPDLNIRFTDSLDGHVEVASEGNTQHFAIPSWYLY